MIFIFEKYLNQIINSPLLDVLPIEDIKHYLSTGQFKIVSYKKNSVIHFDGELCNTLEIILSGKIVIDRIDEAGNLLTISDFYKGDILGGNLTFSSTPNYPMTVSTHSDSVILEISKDLLFELLSSDKKFLNTYLNFISDNTSLLGNKIKYYINKSIRESVINHLKHEYIKQNTYKIKLTVSKKIFAEKIGVQRTSLSRELKKMQDDGLITFDRKYITIKDKSII